MSEEVLRNKVKDLLEKMERVFHIEWRKTKLNLDHEMIEHFIDPKGTFFEPDGSDNNIPWASRDELLISYRSLLEEFGGSLEVIGLSKGEPSVGSSEQGAKVIQKEAITQEIKVEPSSSTEKTIPEPAKIPASITSSHTIPKPQTGTQAIPGPGNVQWPGPMTAPVAVTPAGTQQAFPNPFAEVVNKQEPKNPTAMEGPDNGQSAVKPDPAAIRAIAAKEKFSYLFPGVKTEVIRDFILLEGTNSGTEKPTVIIYALECIWLEFAFPFEEGSRILNKYPQRDPELIEFMKASGHSE